MKDRIAHLFVAKYKEEVIAAWVVWKYGDKLYYPYGASTDRHKEVMAPSLMLWETAKWGKQQGCKVYDLWVADENKGFTRFKEQFGPKLITFVGTYDLIVKPIPYWLFRAAEEIRWKLLKM
jgi:lipid II:glycine glycyltransferase (peptidoglycan interpeptide bridge formation enzyme)